MSLRRAPAFTPDFVEQHTADNLRLIEDHKKFLSNLLNDPKKQARQEKQLCVVCFCRQERGIVAGAAMTQQPCMCCAEIITYSSTDTDVLCMPCAVTEGLCKKCGADRELKPRE